MRRTAAVVVAALTGLLLSCTDSSAVKGARGGADPVGGAPTGAVSPRAAAPPLVVALSVDGLNPDALRVLGRSGAPAFWRMVEEGASTFNARTAVERTVTLPNHTGMLTGRRVGGAHGHGIRLNVDPGGTVHRAAGEYVPSLFDVVHDHGRRTALYATKAKFALFDRTWDGRHGARDRVGADDGRDKIDRFVVDTPSRVVDRLVRRLVDRPPAVSFVHLSLPDKAGHASGWMTQPYLDAVRETDRLLGRVLDAVAADDALAARTTVVLTADHGGVPGDDAHDERTRRANYTIPFLAWGAGVRAGADLYALNPERVDPGTGRPSYAEPPVRNLDLADLVTRLLGYRAVPGGPTAAPLRLS